MQLISRISRVAAIVSMGNSPTAKAVNSIAISGGKDDYHPSLASLSNAGYRGKIFSFRSGHQAVWYDSGSAVCTVKLRYIYYISEAEDVPTLVL